MVIRIAILGDNTKLVALSKLTPMDGTISICTQREPDFFSLLRKKGSPLVLVAEDNNEIIGCISIVKEEMMLADKATSMYYICDLKVHPDYRQKKIGTLLCEAMHDYLLKTDADLVFCTVADGNEKVMPLVFGKAGIEGGINAGLFHILQLLPKKKFSSVDGTIVNKFCNGEYMLNFYTKFSERYIFHPLIRPENYEECVHFAAMKNNTPVSIISLFDPKHLKQYVLVNIPWYYKILAFLLKMAKPLIHTPYLPHKGEQLRILYVKDYAYTPGAEEAFFSLLDFARKYAYENKYSFLSVSFHETNKLRERLRNTMAFPFKSHVIISSLKNNLALVEKMASKNAFLDYSLI